MASSIINSDDGVVSGTSGLKTTGGDDGVLNIQTNGTNAISISSGQRSTFPTTIGVGGATPSTSGAGITFPATQSASSDANTLDDYEEGTWTPTIGTFTLNSGSFGATARYTKIGRLVTVNFYLTSGNVSWSAGNYLEGLPFPPVAAVSVAVGSYTNTAPTVFGNVLAWQDSRIYFANAQSSQTGLVFTITYSI